MSDQFSGLSCAALFELINCLISSVARVVELPVQLSVPNHFVCMNGISLLQWAAGSKNSDFLDDLPVFKGTGTRN